MSNSAFAGLLDDLKAVDGDTETMAKALNEADAKGADEDDAKIREAAGEGDDDDKGDADADAGADEGGEGEASMAKSFMLKLEDGTEVEAVDGGSLLKSMIARVERNEQDTKSALEAAVAVIKGQGELLKSMAERMDRIGNKPVQRKAVLSVNEKPAETLAKSQDAGGTISSAELMAKALTAQVAGRVSGIDIAVAEQQIAQGRQPSDAFVRAVLAE